MKKKLLLLAFLGGMFCCQASAQDVLNEIVKSSLASVNDTTLSMDVRKTAVFKYDAMTYLRSKMLQPAEVMKENVNLDSVNAKVRILNEQALAMNQYVNLYLKRLAEVKKKNKAMVKSLFKQATSEHKYFNDSDTDVTLAYYNRTDYPIPFCLDCDWVKTLAFIRSLDWSGM